MPDDMPDKEPAHNSHDRQWAATRGCIEHHRMQTCCCTKHTVPWFVQSCCCTKHSHDAMDSPERLQVYAVGYMPGFTWQLTSM